MCQCTAIKILNIKFSNYSKLNVKYIYGTKFINIHSKTVSSVLQPIALKIAFEYVDYSSKLNEVFYCWDLNVTTCCSCVKHKYLIPSDRLITLHIEDKSSDMRNRGDLYPKNELFVCIPERIFHAFQVLGLDSFTCQL